MGNRPSVKTEVPGAKGGGTWEGLSSVHIFVTILQILLFIQTGKMVRCSYTFMCHNIHNGQLLYELL